MTFAVIARILELGAVFIALLAIVLWIFRPNTQKRYEEYSKIPLRDE